MKSELAELGIIYERGGVPRVSKPEGKPSNTSPKNYDYKYIILNTNRYTNSHNDATKLENLNK